jgi:hypothetical protein
MPSFLGHFRMFYAFFFNKNHRFSCYVWLTFLRNHKKQDSFPYFWQKNLTHFKKGHKKIDVSIDKMGLKTGHFLNFCVFEQTSMGCFSNSTNFQGLKLLKIDSFS